MTPERRELIRLIALIALSAQARVTDPKNVKKGDWGHLSTFSLIVKFIEEVIEFIVAVVFGWGDSPEHEMGDIVTLGAMILQRKERIKGD